MTTIDRNGTWRKSSKSADNGCLEFTSDAQHTYVRDSKASTGPVLQFALDEWRSFVNAASRDELAVSHREPDPQPVDENGLSKG